MKTKGQILKISTRSHRHKSKQNTKVNSYPPGITNENLLNLYKTLCKPVSVSLKRLSEDDIKYYKKLGLTQRKRKVLWKYGNWKKKKQNKNIKGFSQETSEANKTINETNIKEDAENDRNTKSIAKNDDFEKDNESIGKDDDFRRDNKDWRIYQERIVKDRDSKAKNEESRTEKHKKVKDVNSKRKDEENRTEKHKKVKDVHSKRKDEESRTEKHKKVEDVNSKKKDEESRTEKHKKVEDVNLKRKDEENRTGNHKKVEDVNLKRKDEESRTEKHKKVEDVNSKRKDEESRTEKHRKVEDVNSKRKDEESRTEKHKKVVDVNLKRKDEESRTGNHKKVEDVNSRRKDELSYMKEQIRPEDTAAKRKHEKSPVDKESRVAGKDLEKNDEKIRMDQESRVEDTDSRRKQENSDANKEIIARESDLKRKEEKSRTNKQSRVSDMNLEKEGEKDRVNKENRVEDEDSKQGNEETRVGKKSRVKDTDSKKKDEKSTIDEESIVEDEDSKKESEEARIYKKRKLENEDFKKKDKKSHADEESKVKDEVSKSKHKESRLEDEIRVVDEISKGKDEKIRTYKERMGDEDLVKENEASRVNKKIRIQDEDSGRRNESYIVSTSLSRSSSSDTLILENIRELNDVGDVEMVESTLHEAVPVQPDKMNNTESGMSVSNLVKQINSDSWKFRRKRRLVSEEDEDDDIIQFEANRLKHRRRIVSSDEELNSINDNEDSEAESDETYILRGKELHVVLTRLEDTKNDPLVDMWRRKTEKEKEDIARITDERQSYDESSNRSESPCILIFKKNRRTSYKVFTKYQDSDEESTPSVSNKSETLSVVSASNVQTAHHENKSASDLPCDVPEIILSQTSPTISEKSPSTKGKDDEVYKRNPFVVLVDLNTLGVERKSIYSASAIDNLTKKYYETSKSSVIPAVYKNLVIVQPEKDDSLTDKQATAEPMKNWKLHSLSLEQSTKNITIESRNENNENTNDNDITREENSKTEDLRNTTPSTSKQKNFVISVEKPEKPVSAENMLKLWQQAFCVQTTSKKLVTQPIETSNNDVSSTTESDKEHTEQLQKNPESTTQNTSKTLITIVKKTTSAGSDSSPIFSVKASTVEMLQTPRTDTREKTNNSNKSVDQNEEKDQSKTDAEISLPKDNNTSSLVTSTSKSNQHLNELKKINPQTNVQKCPDGSNLSMKDPESSPRSKTGARYRCLGCHVTCTNYKDMQKHYESHFFKYSTQKQEEEKTKQSESFTEKRSAGRNDQTVPDNSAKDSSMCIVESTTESTVKTNTETNKESTVESTTKSNNTETDKQSTTELTAASIAKSNTKSDTSSKIDSDVEKAKEFEQAGSSSPRKEKDVRKEKSHKSKSETKKAHKVKKLQCANTDSMNCSICAKPFETRDALSAHIYSHTENELQEAYKVALEKLQISKGDNNNVKSKSKTKQQNANVTDKPATTIEDSQRKEMEVDTIASVSIEVENVTEDTQNKGDTVETCSTSKVTDKSIEPINRTELASTSQNQIELNSQSVAVSASTSVSETNVNRTAKLITICECHKDESVSSTFNDFEIEIVLFCRLCRTLFRRIECFVNHYQRIEGSICRTDQSFGRVPKLFCSSCRVILNSLPEMRCHLEGHARKDATVTVRFLCNICKVVFYNLGPLFHTHWFSHSKNSFYMATRLSFPRISLLESAVDKSKCLTRERAQEGYIIVAENVCRYCKVSFEFQNVLKAHEPICSKYNEQGNKGPETSTAENNGPTIIHVQPTCNQKAQGKTDVRIRCNICKITFNFVSMYRDHARQHMNGQSVRPQYLCVFLTPNKVTYVCKLCKNVYDSFPQFEMHWPRHTTIREEFVCTKCDKIFDTYESFTEHVPQHANDDHSGGPLFCNVNYRECEYFCKACGLGFASDEKLKAHSFKHSKSYLKSITEVSGNEIQVQDVEMQDVEVSSNKNIDVDTSQEKNNTATEKTNSPRVDDQSARKCLASENATTKGQTKPSDRSITGNEETAREADDQMENLPDSEDELVIDEDKNDIENEESGKRKDEARLDNTNTANEKQKSDAKEVNSVADKIKSVELNQSSSTAPHTVSKESSSKNNTKETPEVNKSVVIEEPTPPQPKRGFIRVKTLAELTEKTAHSCPSCNLTFDTVEKLTNHTLIHKNEQVTTFPENSAGHIPITISAPVVMNITDTNLRTMTKSSVLIRPATVTPTMSPLVGIVNPVTIQTTQFRNIRPKPPAQGTAPATSYNTHSYNTGQQSQSQQQIRQQPGYLADQQTNHQSVNNLPYGTTDNRNVYHYVFRANPVTVQPTSQVPQTSKNVNVPNTTPITSVNPTFKTVGQTERGPPPPYSSHAFVRSFEMNQAPLQHIPVAPMPVLTRTDSRVSNVPISSGPNQQPNNPVNQQNLTFDQTESDKIFQCPFCPDFSCRRIVDYYRHELTAKHASRRQKAQNSLEKNVLKDGNMIAEQKLKEFNKKIPDQQQQQQTQCQPEQQQQQPQRQFQQEWIDIASLRIRNNSDNISLSSLPHN